MVADLAIILAYLVTSSIMSNEGCPSYYSSYCLFFAIVRCYFAVVGLSVIAADLVIGEFVESLIQEVLSLNESSNLPP